MHCFIRSALRISGIATLTLILTVFLPKLARAVDVTLKPNQGPLGTEVTATGTGWAPNTGVLIYFENQLIGGPVISDTNGAFTTTFCVPPQDFSPGPYPVFFTNGRENFNPPFTITAGTGVNCQSPPKCHDAYFIGLHGTGEGPDSQNHNQTLSPVIVETWSYFQSLATNMGKDVTNYYLDYAGSVQDLIVGAVDPAVDKLNTFIREEVLRVCPTQKIVLVGYSLGAWIVDDWLSRNKDVWPNIAAVELYGDPIWHRTAYSYQGAVVTYDGVARNVLAYRGATADRDDPYTDTLQGPGVGISDRWQSRCLKGDQVCGEGYNFSPVTGANQAGLVVNCQSNSSCMHRRYTKDGVSNNGYNLTERGANFLAFKAFSPLTSHPQVMHHETYREGHLVFFRLFFTNPNDEATGFGFSWNGLPPSDFTFGDPSYGRVHLGQPSVEYPFNHACGTPNAYESDVAAWINYTSEGVQYKTNPVLMHMTCQGVFSQNKPMISPCEVVTPYSTFTWDDAPTSADSCQ